MKYIVKLYILEEDGDAPIAPFEEECNVSKGVFFDILTLIEREKDWVVNDKEAGRRIYTPFLFAKGKKIK